MDDPAVASDSLSLQPWPKHGEKEEPLDYIIGRMFQQRGHLRNLTEEGLEREIKDEAAAKAAAEAEAALEEEESEDEAQQDDKRKREAVYAKRNEMIQSVYTAQQAVLYALDFTSFLLSKDMPKKAEMSMSPTLKVAVPPGTLGYDIWPTTEPSAARKADQNIVSKGWRMRSLNSAADSLLQAAARLEKEVKKETKYWEQVLSISEKGWPVRRLTRESHTLGVQFGFSEAGPQFKERGFAVLRTDEESNIILDQGLTRVPQSVRVRIARSGDTVGTSSIPSLSSDSEASVEDLIHRARDSLFEEELFHEIMLETRNLISYDVKVRDSTVHVPVPPCDAKSLSNTGRGKHEVLIDLVPLDDSIIQQPDQLYDGLANYIAIALRILLCHTHRQRLHRRSQLPPPLSERKRPSPPSSILRPLLNYLQHYAAVDATRRYAAQTTSVLRNAGLTIDATFKTDLALPNLLNTNRPSTSPSPSTSTTDSLITALTSPLTTTITLTLPSSSPANNGVSDNLTLTIRTHLTAPTLGTAYTLTLPTPLSTLLFSSPTHKPLAFPSFTELTSYLNFLLSMDVAHHVIAAENEEWRGVKGEPEVAKTVEVGRGRRTKKVGVKVGEGRHREEEGLMVWWRWAEMVGRAEEVRWDGRGEGEGRGLREVVEGFMK